MITNPYIFKIRDMRLIRINFCLVVIIFDLFNLKGVFQDEIKKFELKTGVVGFPGLREYKYSPKSTKVDNVVSLSSIRPWTSTFNQKLTSFGIRTTTISDFKSDNVLSSTALSYTTDGKYLPLVTLKPKHLSGNKIRAIEISTTETYSENTTLNSENQMITQTEEFLENTTTSSINFTTEFSTKANERPPRKIINETIFNLPMSLTPSVTPNQKNNSFVAHSDSINASQAALSSPQEIAHKITSRKITNETHSTLIGPTFTPNISNSTSISRSGDEKTSIKTVTGSIPADAGSFSDLSPAFPYDSITVSSVMFTTVDDSSNLTESSEDNETENEPTPTPKLSENIEIHGHILPEKSYIILTIGCLTPVVVATLILVILGYSRYKDERRREIQNRVANLNELERRYS